jgi:lipoprotein-anchoring transpeptidase ErfK/SrfK
MAGFSSVTTATTATEETAGPVAPAVEDAAPPEERRSKRRQVLLGAAGGVLFVLAVLALLAVRYDRAHRDDLLPGVRVGGLPVGGLEAAAVQARFDAQIDGDLGDRTVQVVAGAATDTLTLREMGLRSDVAEALARARADADDMGMARRLWHRLLDEPVERSYDVEFSVQRTEVRSALASVQSRVARAPVDARVDLSSGMVSIVPAVEGRYLDLTAATDRTRAAADLVASGKPAPVVEAPLIARRPNVTGFADVILIRTGENRLYHYENGVLRRSYVVATGTPRYPTPKGNFQITLKRYRPVWVNPDPHGWGRSLPRSIPPGPGNPLGTRALNLNSPGIRIHGTSNVRSLGTAASHGCIRMAMPEVEELFELVEVGTPVYIITGPATAPAAATPQTTFGDPNAPIDLEGGG